MSGLNSRFQVSNGKIVLSSGVDKSQDAIWFYCIFDNFRVYATDFGGNLATLLQKPTSMLVMNRTILLGNLQKGIEKYVPTVRVNDLDIGYNPDDRKEYALMVDYTAVNIDKTETNDVIFV